MLTSKKIKILKNIPSIAAGDKSLLKAFETFFYLKHHYDAGIISSYSKNAGKLAGCCHISERTLWTRISLLKRYKLAKVKEGRLILASWDDICTKFKTKKYFYYAKFKDVQLELVLEAKALFESKKRMQAAYKLKINNNPGLKQELCRISGSKEFSRRAVLRCAMQSFTNPELYNAAEIEMLTAHNSDDNLNCFSIAEMFNNRTSSRSGTYTKRKLVAAGLIRVEHRRMESTVRQRQTPIGCVYYSRPTKRTFAIMPDNIDII